MPNNKDTRSKEYTKRLNNKVGWKKFVDIQMPYRMKMRSMKLGKTLDIGCGTGRNLVNLDKESIGIDHNKYSIRHLSSKGLNAYTTSDFDKLKYREKFDSILLAHVIEHMKYDEAKSLINKYKKYLKKDGRLFIICPQIRGYGTDQTHVEFFDQDKITMLINECGFENVHKSSFPFHEYFGKYFTYNEYWNVGKFSSKIHQ